MMRPSSRRIARPSASHTIRTPRLLLKKDRVGGEQSFREDRSLDRAAAFDEQRAHHAGQGAVGEWRARAFHLEVQQIGRARFGQFTCVFSSSASSAARPAASSRQHIVEVIEGFDARQRRSLVATR